MTPQVVQVFLAIARLAPAPDHFCGIECILDCPTKNAAQQGPSQMRKPTQKGFLLSSFLIPFNTLKKGTLGKKNPGRSQRD